MTPGLVSYFKDPVIEKPYLPMNSFANGPVAWWLAVAVASQPTRVRPRIGAFPWCCARPCSKVEWGWKKSPDLKKTNELFYP
jgi:hypothetical protein